MIAALRALAIALLGLLQRLFGRRAPTPPPGDSARPAPSPAPSAPASAPASPRRAPAWNHWRSIEDYFRSDVRAWEGGFQADPVDVGNYVQMPDGTRRLVGTNRGVTAATWAAFIGIPAHEVTVEQVRAITADQAVQVGVRLFYEAPGFARLTWCPAVEVMVDWAWGSGPARPIRALQTILGVSADGRLGPVTAAAFEAWLARVGHAAASDAIADARYAHWESISRPGSRFHKYRRGWLRRANHTRSTNPEWWKL